VRCSKGTYIRTLVEDIAGALGTVAHVQALRRIGVGAFEAGAMIRLDVLEAHERDCPEGLDRKLLPVDSGISHWPRLVVERGAANRLAHGQQVMQESSPPDGLVRLYTSDTGFFGIAEVGSLGEVVPKRIFPMLGAWSSSADEGRIRGFLAGTD
jgi:tRNA pseudouridine55 synthase